MNSEDLQAPGHSVLAEGVIEVAVTHGVASVAAVPLSQTIRTIEGLVLQLLQGMLRES